MNSDLCGFCLILNSIVGIHWNSPYDLGLGKQWGIVHQIVCCLCVIFHGVLPYFVTR